MTGSFAKLSRNCFADALIFSFLCDRAGVFTFCTGIDVFIADAVLDHSFTDHSFMSNVLKNKFLHTGIKTPLSLKWYLKVTDLCDCCCP